MEERILDLLKKEGQQKAAFELIVSNFSERLYWHIRRMVTYHDDADDVLQNTFIKIWKNINSFRGDSKLYTWLYKIATNESLDHIRRNKKLEVVDSEVENMGYLNAHGDIYFDSDLAEAKLHQAIAALPEKQRLVFNLKYFEEMKYEDMAKVTGTSVGALKASYHLAVGKIKESLTTQLNP